MDLNKLIKREARLLPHIDVIIDSAQDWVTIIDIATGDSVFLDGHQAAAFISAAKALYEQCGDVTMEECLKFQAKDYVCLLGE